MYADIYRDLDHILSQDETDAFWDALAYLLEVPRFRRACFYFHTFTRTDGRSYRSAFLTLKFLRVLAWRCRLARYSRQARLLFGC